MCTMWLERVTSTKCVHAGNPNTPSEQLDAACSSVIVADDKSNYWAPELYYQHANGTFSPILSGTRIYYFTKGDQVKPFPTGLKMISGTAASKNASDTKAFGVKISCDEGEQGYWLPNVAAWKVEILIQMTTFPTWHGRRAIMAQSLSMIPTVNTVQTLIP